MIDYGLFALIVVILVLVFLAFHAWRSIRAEADRISAQWTRIEARIVETERSTGRALAEAEGASTLAREVQGSHYTRLLKRIDDAEATGLGCLKQCEVLSEKIASHGGRLSALSRWRKEAQAPEAPDDDTTVPMFPAAPVPPQGNIPVPGHFGRMARKVG